MRDLPANSPGEAPLTQRERLDAFTEAHRAHAEPQVYEPRRRSGNGKAAAFLGIDAVYGATGHPFGWFMFARDLVAMLCGRRG